MKKKYHENGILIIKHGDLKMINLICERENQISMMNIQFQPSRTIILL